MTAKIWSGAPFGISRPRFTADGIHPKNRLPGTFLGGTDINREIGPGKYDIDDGCFSNKQMMAKAARPGWTRELELEKSMGLPYILNKELLREHREIPRRMGPGKYSPMTEGIKKQTSNRGMLDTLEPRFKDRTNNYPGPGTYGYPDCRLEEKKKRAVGRVEILGGGGSRTSDITLGCKLGPGQYKVEQGSVDAVLSKLVSTRGPYDLFTAERGAPINTGHYATLKTYNLGPGQYEITSDPSSLASDCKKYHGQFPRQARFPRRPVDRIFFNLSQYPRDPAEPGPGQYDMTDNMKKPMTQGSISALPPFNSTTQKDDKQSVQFFTGNYNPVGVGRYDMLRFEESQRVNGHTSDFISKLGRPSLEDQKVLAERIRPREVPGEAKPLCEGGSGRKPGDWFDMYKEKGCQ